MKTIKTIIIIGSFFCFGLAALFIYLGFINFKGDLAGWVQSGIAIIEIPILIYGLFRILDEVQRKPVFDYGLIKGTIPSDLTEYFESSLPKQISISSSSLPRDIHFMLFNKGKLSSEDIYIVLKYKQFGEECHPVIHDHTDLSAMITQRITNSSSLDYNVKILHPYDHDYFSFEIFPNPLENCLDQLTNKWNLELAVEIYSRELSTPIKDSVFIDLE